MIKGYSTKEATQRYLDRLMVRTAMHKLTPWFSCSAIAIGTHMGDMSAEHSDLYIDAVSEALTGGINMIDTALNYRGMKSERDVGKALTSLIQERKLVDRDAVIISTKGGIIPGDVEQNMNPEKYFAEVIMRSSIVPMSEVNKVGRFRHTLSPSFYEFALEKSRKNLNLSTIDIYYIHNPEYSMEALGKGVFYEKLPALFEFLESKVKSGEIRFYGMAAWRAFQVPFGGPGYISLEKVMEIARQAGGDDHHFRFIQIPYNIGYPDAVNEETQEVGKDFVSAIDAALKLGLYVTVSNPLNRGGLLSTGKSATELIEGVINTEGVYATMVGMKKAVHVRQNIRTILT